MAGLDDADDATPDEPAPESRRIASLDFTRGVAVLGIVIANIIAFGQPFMAYSYPGAFLVPPQPTDTLLWMAQLVLIDGKLRGVFTLLFGAGLYLFMERAWARGEETGLQLRRLAWLALFGLAHFVLLWRGDILFSYAFAGALALLFLELPPRRLLLLGVLAYCGGAVLSYSSSVPLAQAAAGHFASGSTEAAYQQTLITIEQQQFAQSRREAAILQRGDYPAFVAETAREHLPDLLSQTVYFAFETLPLMLIGMALYRLGVFEGRIAARRQALWGGALWLAGTAATVPIALWAAHRELGFFAVVAAMDGWSALPRLPAAIGLTMVLAVIGHRAHGWFARRLADAGRTAFTNYLGTSLVLMLVLPGWGLGLFGRLDRLQLYGVVVVVWAMMLAWPGPWLKSFRYGPLEWLWRCLTCSRRFPLHRTNNSC